MISLDSLVDGRVPRAGDSVAISLAPGFQGLPDMAHGGTVLGLFDAASAERGPREVRAHYRKRVPLATSLAFSVRRGRDGVACHLVADDGTLLVDGDVRAQPVPASSFDASPFDAMGAVPRIPSTTLPVSARCFVCGVENTTGLRARLAFDDTHVVGHWQASEQFRTPSGALAPVALTALLDEAAFWLGALGSGEAGMTTELAVSVAREVAFDTALTVVGERARVRVRDDDARYRDAELSVVDDRGRPVATARITFVAVRGAARRLAKAMLAQNPPELLRRVFPDALPASTLTAARPSPRTAP